MADGQEQRSDKELIKASNVYAQEQRGRSWFHVLSTLGLLAACVAVAGSELLPWPARLIGSVLAGLLIVRSFIVFHDFKHGSILRGSRVARVLLDTFGILCLTPSNVWKQTHNYHHAHTAKLVGSHVGSYMMVSHGMWDAIDGKQRLMYRIIRHPLTILFGYLTVFLYGMCMSSFLRKPRKNWDSGVAIALHIAIVVGVWNTWGFTTVLLAVLVPHFISHALGAYLFYAQHNFPEAYVQSREEWNFVRASMDSSSYMKMGPIMAYFAGNIGYHHVHHLNYRIPFYRLPEAMAGIPELQNPRGVTSLNPRDIAACLRLKIWDQDQEQLVSYPKA